MTRFVGILVLCLTLPVSASGITLEFAASLSGANENPAVPSAGTGSALVTIDTAIHNITVDTSWSGLTGNTTVAHIHCCVAPPANVGVATFPGTFPGFPVGVTAGSYNAAWFLDDTASYTAAFLAGAGGTAAGAEAALIAGLQAGEAYLNIHTDFAAGGEIRGFLIQVPEPAAAALLAAALVGLAVGRGRPAPRA